MATFNYEAVKDLLRCPRSRAELVLADDALISCDPETRLKYPIVDGFPVMLADEAVTLSPEDWGTIMTKDGRDEKSGQRIPASS